MPEGKFRQAFDNAPIGMAVIDFNFRFRRVNAALCRALDYSPAELLQQRLAEILGMDSFQADIGIGVSVNLCLPERLKKLLRRAHAV